MSAGRKTGRFELVTLEQCRTMNEKVLFFIFYSLPFDKSQAIAANVLRERNWVYCEKSMRWFKAMAKSSGKGKRGGSARG